MHPHVPPTSTPLSPDIWLFTLFPDMEDRLKSFATIVDIGSSGLPATKEVRTR